ncbi:HlyD family efflux transporter periplasmic adaptor subunit [Micromonospora terminaliae]|uniref:HlyD family efflux transporter periplasmic adaptor subunit n=1 Tax=Micromonospora terminaliae TaxID=1914461 RepID=A0AAJ2ZBF9_9ACTN|nr:HlyD family efflux transporter periplasmic adaptor subunit [Micromonospora terminaliae]NES27132.1 HlyD family efflux transporter periplasmic adaptor subunit [Micromonospora terminaliae]QGL48103.1 HlyD family efflux transporter periplasmic adaptor subunit [Micromonospora terminaliae]
MSRRRGTGTVLAVAVAAPLAAGAAYALGSEPSAPAAPAASVATGTAEVTQGTLTERVQIGGVLGYAGSYTVDHQGAPGVLTAGPDSGDTIARGGVLYRVADAPVRLLLGDVPAYRDFRYGMSDGPDVRQLERNLVAMGFDPHHRITVDRHFSSATATAIRRWEATWGRPAYQRTGRLGQGEIVFLPTPLRVTQLQVRVGGTVGPGATVLTGTSNNRAVIAQLDTAQRSTVHVGDQVEVGLPDADPIHGRVTAVGDVATAPSADAGNGPPQPANPDLATVPLTIAVQLPRGSGLDQAPVTVDIVTGTRRDVLLIPIAALLARPGGGYQVRLNAGAAVQVEPGSFDESTGQVEIVRGLTAGQTVEVPAT